MRRWTWVATVVVSACVGAAGSTFVEQVGAAAKAPSLTALDYQEINQLINRYAYGIDTCSNNGYDYADVFTPDGVFIDKNSDQGFAQGGRVLAKGRDALATLVGGGSRGCKTKLVWTDWSHIMTNLVVTPTPRRRNRANLSDSTRHEGPRQRRATRRLRGRLREDERGLAHPVTHARAQQGVAQPSAANRRFELTLQRS